ncbi:16S rRNA (guanine(527)-N(7))-methyltransferase RsmG [Sphingomonas sp. MA1305]|uniref:16S rRNA (guanine(527)-N(7))-methyltransferase RsmG n=1 Tax=Sphingomonas sp. MA1305 TaxID=2479204 RepID=UPI0018E04739|nr:16S rRNA (guanine(527)-N(7))-methyltransferase RsmG [Sphingomonas sp. MA1305]MBI0475659.1 16S rRNA (guanine(527)-N(7))-methyltransferase RsmG [Sphingomonas sp. MA1305]
MTEEEARGWIAAKFGETLCAQVGAFLDMVRAENAQQNLIAPSTIDALWLRHALDSAQLVDHAGSGARDWLDVGTGGGFPGMVVAILFDGEVTMVEPRRRRALFLNECVEKLGLSGATVRASRVEQVEGRYDVISARAVASVEKLLHAAAHCARSDTRWVLPRGRIEPEQLQMLRRDRGWVFHVKQSLTSADSSILLVERKS